MSDSGEKLRQSGQPDLPVDASGADAGALPTLGRNELMNPWDGTSRYRIIQQIGAGGAGVVYKAHDSEANTIVALKVLHPQFATDAGFLDHFRAELLLARKITHKNVCRVYDLNKLANSAALSMEFIDGDSLRSVLSKGRISIDDGLKIIRQALSGVAEAHAQNVIHRDLKPENILIAKDGTVKIMDFGLARSVHNTATGRIVGTPAYMSPEQVEGKPADKRSDIYAIGLIMYEVFSGTGAFKGESAVSVAMKQLHEKPASPRLANSDISKTLETIILRCIEKDPARRFQTVAELEAALDEYAIPTQSGSSSVALTAVSSRRWKWVATAVVAVLVAGGGVWFLNSIKPPSAVNNPPVKILIADFDNRTHESVFDGTLEPMLGVALEGAPFISVYSRRLALNSANQLRPGTTRLDDNLARLVADRDGINVVVAGSIEPAGQTYKLTVRAILDPVTATRNVSKAVTANSRNDVLAAVARLAIPIRNALGDTTPESVQRAAGETFTSSSIEAIQVYVAAQQLQQIGKCEEAIQKYSLAVQLDPNFGRALAGIGVCYANLNNYTEAEKYLQEGLNHLDRMTDREKYRTRGGYFLAIQDYKAAVDEYTKLLKEYPADYAARNNLAIAYFGLHDLKDAAGETRRASEIYPKIAVLRNNAALYEMWANEFAGAEQDAQAALELNPGYAKAYVIAAISRLAQAHADQAETTYEKMKTISASAASLAFIGLADTAYSEGRFRDGMSILEHGLSGDQTNNNLDSAARKLIMLADASRVMGDAKKAISLVDRAVASSKDEVVVTAAARIYAEENQAQVANVQLTALKKAATANANANAKANVAIIEGDIRMASRDLDGAIDLFRNAISYNDPWLAHYELGLAYLGKKAFPEASSEFETCIKRRGEAADLFHDEVPTFYFYPAAYYYLAKAQEGMVSAPAARDSYRTFLSFQANNSDSPLAADARRRSGIN